jgi:hypothetical protein
VCPSIRSRQSIDSEVTHGGSQFPAGASLNSPKDVPIATLIGPSDVSGVTAQDPRYTNARIPDAVNGLHEGDIRTKGHVHVVALESNGDYHIQVTDHLHGTATDFIEGGNWMVGQVYMPILIEAATTCGAKPRGKSVRSRHSNWCPAPNQHPRLSLPVAPSAWKSR